MKTRYSHGWTDPRGVFGSGSTIRPRFDIRHSIEANLFPEINHATYEDLANLWMVKFGLRNVSLQDLERSPDEWRYIAHILFKRNRLTEWTDGATTSDTNGERFYRIRDWVKYE